MSLLKEFWHLIGGFRPYSGYLYLFIGVSVINVLLLAIFKSRKIQPNGFKWKSYRTEVAVGLLNVTFSGLLLGSLTAFLTTYGHLSYNSGPTHWWVIALEYTAYFFAFDTWFYWFHRLMHKEPIYSWVHKFHHFSTSPNLLTTLSVNPLESLINGGFVAIFATVVTVHQPALLLMNLTAALMGFYVHSGYEFLPRWWNRSWATKWFISATFHDQHHKYFRYNFGGYTTIWDRICGTDRPKFEADFDKIKERAAARKPSAQAPVGVHGEEVPA